MQGGDMKKITVPLLASCAMLASLGVFHAVAREAPEWPQKMVCTEGGAALSMEEGGERIAFDSHGVPTRLPQVWRDVVLVHGYDSDDGNMRACQSIMTALEICRQVGECPMVTRRMSCRR
jgi:hypothetical protein